MLDYLTDVDKRLREERKQRIFEMYLACATLEEIASEVGLDKATVSRNTELSCILEEVPKSNKLLADFADADFEAPLLNGLNTTVAMIKRLCAEDKETLDLIDRATQGKRGKHTYHGLNKPMIENKRDRSGRDIRQLRKQYPDIHAQVIAGDLSPHAAAVAAGIRKPTHTITHDVDAAARALRRHFTADELRTHRYRFQWLIGTALCQPSTRIATSAILSTHYIFMQEDAPMPARTPRAVTFRCEYCGQDRTELHPPGPTPHYCAVCKDEALRHMNARRVRMHRERTHPKTGWEQPRGRPRKG